MSTDPELRAKLAKEGRLWLLALVCATAGGVTVAVTDRVAPGVVAFLLAVAVLGPLLYLLEHRRTARATPRGRAR